MQENHQEGLPSLRNLAADMLARGKSEENVAAVTKLPLDTVHEIASLLSVVTVRSVKNIAEENPRCNWRHIGSAL